MKRKRQPTMARGQGDYYCRKYNGMKRIVKKVMMVILTTNIKTVKELEIFTNETRLYNDAWIEAVPEKVWKWVTLVGSKEPPEVEDRRLTDDDASEGEDYSLTETVEQTTQRRLRHS